MNVEIDELTSNFEVRDGAKIRKDVAAAVTDAIHDIAEPMTAGVEPTTDPSDPTPAISDAPGAQAAPPIDDSLAGETE